MAGLSKYFDVVSEAAKECRQPDLSFVNKNTNAAISKMVGGRGAYNESLCDLLVDVRKKKTAVDAAVDVHDLVVHGVVSLIHKTLCAGCSSVEILSARCFRWCVATQMKTSREDVLPSLGESIPRTPEE